MSNEAKLGTVPNGNEGRDAVHVAIVPAIAAEAKARGGVALHEVLASTSYHLLAKYGNHKRPVGTFEAGRRTPSEVAAWIVRELKHRPSQIVVTRLLGHNVEDSGSCGSTHSLQRLCSAAGPTPEQCAEASLQTAINALRAGRYVDSYIECASAMASIVKAKELRSPKPPNDPSSRTGEQRL